MTDVIGENASDGSCELARLGGRGGFMLDFSRFVFSSEKIESVDGLTEIYWIKKSIKMIYLIEEMTNYNHIFSYRKRKIVFYCIQYLTEYCREEFGIF